MNKQEAIEELQDVAQRVFYRTGSRAVHIDKIVEVVNQIDEPQKVVVPKFVAEWIVEMKQDERPLYSVMSSLMNKTNHEWDVWKSANMNFSEIVAQAWIYGYEIEKEKLYTVEIPDPHGMYKIRYLFRNSVGNIRIGGSTYREIFLDAKTHLTEAEIKKDFEWAWNAGFAKEVE